MSTHLVIPDSHAHYQHNNERATWLSKLIADVKPDVVINIGDQADMPSLSGYDKGKRTFNGRTYRADIEASQDFSARLWEPLRRRKKKLPRKVFLIGNHEERIGRVLNLQPELEGAIGYKDLSLEEDYDEVVHYDGNTPGSITIDGITYSHYFITGVSGRPITSEVSPASALLAKNLSSSTVGHSHLLDFSVRTNAIGQKMMGLSVGCFIDYHTDWAGEVNRLWSRGIAIKRNVEDGAYDLQWVSIDALRKEYGT